MIMTTSIEKYKNDIRKLILAGKALFKKMKENDDLAQLRQDYEMWYSESYAVIKIVLPDKDKSGKELIDIALDKGWWVSLPDWPEKDASDAVSKYGRLVTLTHIFQSIHKTPLKIQLHTKKYISGN